MGLIQDRIRLHIDGLVQGKRYSIANALELRLPCTKPSIWSENLIDRYLICFASFSFCVLFFVFSLSITWRDTVLSQ